MARLDEAPTIAELWLRSRRAAKGIPPAAHSDDEVRAWFCEVVIPTRELWITELRGELTGLMVLDGEQLEQLYVAPEFLRQGHGSRLVRLAQQTRSALALWTFEANLSARAFYEAHGFRAQGPPSIDNEERTAAIQYKWTRSV